jgi:peptide/nickel transport system permease protein
MRGYAIRRFLLIIPTLLILTLILFFMVRMIPGSIIDLMATEHVSQAGVELNPEDVKAMLGLDKPIYVQYGEWVWGLLHGDLGISLWTHSSMIDELRVRLPVTVELSLFSMVVGIVFSVPIGVYAAIRQDTIADYIMRTISIAALAIPSFWIATMVIVYPAIWWGWMPSIEYVPLVKDPLANLGQFLLPAVILGMSTSGGTMRITRTMMLEVMRQDYIRTAWSKGLKERTVIVRHAVKNTLIPVITIVGGMIPSLLGGSVIIEQIFDMPGMGRYLLDAVQSRDYLIISGWNLIISFTVLLIIVLTDLSYAFVDPRIRYK